MTSTSTATLSQPAPTPESGRVQLAINVNDLATAVDFYTKLLGTGPAKLRDGYANFAVASPPLKLVLIENPGHGGSLNHLGIEVPSSEKVHSEIARFTEEGLFTAEELGATCCFATQDKVWVAGPDGERWETYTVLADSDTFGTSPKTATAEDGTCGPGVCCGDTGTASSGDTAPACC